MTGEAVGGTVQAGGALTDDRRVVGELDGCGREVRAQQFDRLVVGMTEPGAVGTDQDRSRVDEVEKFRCHVVHAPVVSELEQIHLEARQVPLAEQPGNRLLQIRRIGVAGQQQRRSPYSKRNTMLEPLGTL